MEYQEINKLLQYNDYKGCESKLFMPNEVFDDLKKSIKNTPHIAFAYSYLYLVTWIYRYCKYIVGNNIISNSGIKEILGYSPDTRTINYLITKNGLLDKIGYLETHKDFPVWWNRSEFETLEFVMYSDEKELFKNHNIPKNYTIKFPIKAFERTVVSGDDELETSGTFYDVHYTHNIPFEVFMYCMSKDDIGCTGFYLYAYLQHKNDIYTNGYIKSLENLVEETGIAERTLDKYLGMLKGYKMIDFQHNQEFFAIGMKAEDRRPNTYTTNKYLSFKDKPEEFKRIEIVKKKDYFNKLKEKEDGMDKLFAHPDQVEVQLADLPY